METKELISDLTYMNYRFNRLRSPLTTPKQWSALFDKIEEKEARFLKEYPNPWDRIQAYRQIKRSESEVISEEITPEQSYEYYIAERAYAREQEYADFLETRREQGWEG